jgi:hypothetical protein
MKPSHIFLALFLVCFHSMSTHSSASQADKDQKYNAKDPHELKNLAGDPAFAKTVEEMKELLKRLP